MRTARAAPSSSCTFSQISEEAEMAALTLTPTLTLILTLTLTLLTLTLTLLALTLTLTPTLTLTRRRRRRRRWRRRPGRIARALPRWTAPAAPHARRLRSPGGEAARPPSPPGCCGGSHRGGQLTLTLTLSLSLTLSLTLTLTRRAGPTASPTQPWVVGAVGRGRGTWGVTCTRTPRTHPPRTRRRRALAAPSRALVAPSRALVAPSRAPSDP